MKYIDPTIKLSHVYYQIQSAPTKNQGLDLGVVIPALSW